jgi:glycosyltransferase involved in cell wall biosynthesis
MASSASRSTRFSSGQTRHEPPPLPNYTILYSSANDLDLDRALGARHYSYLFAEDHFLKMFAASGFSAIHLPMPEYYGQRSALAAEIDALGAHPIHLMFRSTEDFRLLKCGYNIACFAWEFDVLKDYTQIGEHPFLNQNRMLGICDEIWVPAQYTREVLVSHGIGNVQHIPAPIALPAPRPRDRYDALARLADITVCPLFVNFLMPRALNRDICSARCLSLGEWLARKMARRDRVRLYLTILNPEDFRKNLDAMLRGFYYFACEDPDSVLIVKALTAQSRFSLVDVVSDVVRNKMGAGTNLECDNIVFFNDFLKDEALSWLYTLADFYLCASVAEGQNLPLLEAMAHGVIPITTRHTAMLDYIARDNAVIIRDRTITNDSEHFGGCVAGKPFVIHRSEHSDIYDALRRSTSIPEAQRSKMSARCVNIVRERYSYQKVWDLIRSRLEGFAGAPDDLVVQ